MATLGSSFISCAALDKTSDVQHFNCGVSPSGCSRGISREAISRFNHDINEMLFESDFTKGFI